MIKRILPILLIVLLAAAFDFWTDQDKIGTVQSVTGSAVAVAQGEKRPLAAKDPVYEKDLVAVGTGGFLQIMFKDGTVLAMREQSEVELRQFAYEIGQAEDSMVDLNMVSGGLRFLTGKAVTGNPERCNVETPLGTIGIRGTEGTAETSLGNAGDYASNLDASIGAPGTGWNRSVSPQVSNMSVNHVNGQASRAMTFTDRFGKTVSLDRGQGVDVDRQAGAGSPRANPPGTAIPNKQRTPFNKLAPTPKEYRNRFGGYAGGGQTSSVAPGAGLGSGEQSAGGSSSSSGSETGE